MKVKRMVAKIQKMAIVSQYRTGIMTWIKMLI